MTTELYNDFDFLMLLKDMFTQPLLSLQGIFLF